MALVVVLCSGIAVALAAFLLASLGARVLRALGVKAQRVEEHLVLCAAPALRRERARPLILCRLFVVLIVLGDKWVWFVGVDAQIFDGILDCGFADQTFLRQFMECGDGDEAGVDFEEVTERGAGFAAAESVGA